MRKLVTALALVAMLAVVAPAQAHPAPTIEISNVVVYDSGNDIWHRVEYDLAASSGRITEGFNACSTTTRVWVAGQGPVTLSGGRHATEAVYNNYIDGVRWVKASCRVEYRGHVRKTVREYRTVTGTNTIDRSIQGNCD